MKNLAKSTVKAMKCEQHFAAYHIEKRPELKAVSDPATRETGKSFHQFRSDYVRHLVASQKNSDPEWARAWLDDNVITDDTRWMVLRDAKHFSLDWSRVYGAEVYLSVDEDFQPLDRLKDAEFGKFWPHRDAYAGGFIDLLQIDTEEGVARACDFKTKYNTQGVDEDEAEIYAALIFAHFDVNHVEWAWEFIRADGALRRMSFTREQLPRLQGAIRNHHARRAEIERKHWKKQKLSANPYSGMCGWCEYNCTLRQHPESLVVPALESDEQARELSLSVRGAEDFLGKARKALRGWVDEKGPVKLDDEHELQIVLGTNKSLPLPDVLEMLRVPDSILTAMGYPELSPESEARLNITRAIQGGSYAFDVPLAKLMISASSLNGYAKAKKREGLKQAIDDIADLTPTSEVRIVKVAKEEKPE